MDKKGREARGKGQAEREGRRLAAEIGNFSGLPKPKSQSANKEGGLNPVFDGIASEKDRGGDKRQRPDHGPENEPGHLSLRSGCHSSAYYTSFCWPRRVTQGQIGTPRLYSEPSLPERSCVFVVFLIRSVGFLRRDLEDDDDCAHESLIAGGFATFDLLYQRVRAIGAAAHAPGAAFGGDASEPSRTISNCERGFGRSRRRQHCARQYQPDYGAGDRHGS